MTFKSTVQRRALLLFIVVIVVVILVFVFVLENIFSETEHFAQSYLKA
jgi:ABC-type transporter Mla subunit MlaD